MTNKTERILVWEEKNAIGRLRQSIQVTADIINRYHTKYPIESPADIPSNVDGQIMDEYLAKNKLARDMNSIKRLSINEVSLPEDLKARRAAVNEYNSIKKDHTTFQYIVKKDGVFAIDEDKFNQAVDEKGFRKYLTTEEEIARFNFAKNYLQSIEPFIKSEYDKPNFKIPAISWGQHEECSLYHHINFLWVRNTPFPG